MVIYDAYNAQQFYYPDMTRFNSVTYATAEGTNDTRTIDEWMLLNIQNQTFNGVDAMLSAGDFLEIGQSYSTGGTTWKMISKSDPVVIGDFEPLGSVNLKDLGAVGGDGVKDTSAFILAFSLGFPIEVPPVTFHPALISKIGFGVNPRFNGDPTYANTIIADLNRNTCSGLESSDFVGFPYRVNPAALNASLSSLSFTADSATFERLPIWNSHLTASNSDNVVNASNIVVLRRTGTHKVDVTSQHHGCYWAINGITDCQYISK